MSGSSATGYGFGLATSFTLLTLFDKVFFVLAMFGFLIAFIGALVWAYEEDSK